MNLPPIDVSGENILTLPVKKRQPVGEGFLQPVPYGKCGHRNGPFEVDVKGGKCKCLSCGDEVSPMFVLENLMNQESQWMRTRASYLDEMKRLAERSRTKCDQCGKMTRISHK
jgi:hypothetical protein